uniref:uncharacterized protein LOC120346056 isoform X2 n=1 Tax=Styela clava TaxID=7725 RepID=UPI001939C94D|nr:uncharacterized protein LOC120346056 isoform X2 [Styela clava]
MEYRIAGATGSILMKNLSVWNLIGGTYINPSSFLFIPGLGGLLTKEFLLEKAPLFSENHVFLMKWQRMQFSDHFRKISNEFKNDCDKLDRFQYYLRLNKAIEMTYKIISAEKTSAVIDAHITDVDEDKNLATHRALIVCVSKATGKPACLPQELPVEKRSSVVKLGDMMTGNLMETAPEGSVTKYVGREDVAFLDYVPHHKYLNFCLDSLAVGGTRNGFTNLPGNLPIWNYQIRSCSLLYLKQAKLGDRIQTFYWKDPADIWSFYFKTMRNQESIAEARVEMTAAK